jgi:hypothetical protein
MIPHPHLPGKTSAIQNERTIRLMFERDLGRNIWYLFSIP